MIRPIMMQPVPPGAALCTATGPSVRQFLLYLPYNAKTLQKTLKNDARIPRNSWTSFPPQKVKGQGHNVNLSYSVTCAIGAYTNQERNHLNFDHGLTKRPCSLKLVSTAWSVLETPQNFRTTTAFQVTRCTV